MRRRDLGAEYFQGAPADLLRAFRAVCADHAYADGLQAALLESTRLFPQVPMSWLIIKGQLITARPLIPMTLALMTWMTLPRVRKL